MFDAYSFLSAYALFTLLTIAVQIYFTRRQVGFAMMISDRQNMPKLTGLAGRLDRAQANNVVALALVAPAALILGAKGWNSAADWLALTFLVMRVLYTLAYAANWGLARMAVWLVSYIAIAALYIIGL